MERKGGLKVGEDGLIAADKFVNFTIAHVSPVLVVLLIQCWIDPYYTDFCIGTFVLFVHLLHDTNLPGISCIGLSRHIPYWLHQIVCEESPSFFL